MVSASLPIIEIDVLGSNDTSWKPGPRYWTTLLMASPPPQATILSKYCGRYRTRSTDSSPPRQYAADMDATTGCPGSMSAIVRRIATVVNGSLDDILNRLTALTSAPCAMDFTATPGELPGSTWIRRGGKARTKLLRPVKSSLGTQESSASGSGKFSSTTARSNRASR